VAVMAFIFLFNGPQGMPDVSQDMFHVLPGVLLCDDATLRSLDGGAQGPSSLP
jgi:hypothetical protein